MKLEINESSAYMIALEDLTIIVSHLTSTHVCKCEICTYLIAKYKRSIVKWTAKGEL
jgi:hypothetical protein